MAPRRYLSRKLGRKSRRVYRCNGARACYYEIIKGDALLEQQWQVSISWSRQLASTGATIARLTHHDAGAPVAMALCKRYYLYPGGYSIKPAQALNEADMGGAATVTGLALAISRGLDAHQAFCVVLKI